MDKLLFVPDIMERYHCSAPTARARMRQMKHMEKPLAVYESELLRWEFERMHAPGETKAKKKPGRRERITWVPGVSKIPMRA